MEILSPRVCVFGSAPLIKIIPASARQQLQPGPLFKYNTHLFTTQTTTVGTWAHALIDQTERICVRVWGKKRRAGALRLLADSINLGRLPSPAHLFALSRAARAHPEKKRVLSNSDYPPHTFAARAEL